MVNGLTDIGMSARSGLALLTLRIAILIRLTGFEFCCEAPFPRTIIVQPGARAISLMSLAMWRFGMLPLVRIGVLGVNGGSGRLCGGVWGVGLSRFIKRGKKRGIEGRGGDMCNERKDDCGVYVKVSVTCSSVYR